MNYSRDQSKVEYCQTASRKSLSHDGITFANYLLQHLPIKNVQLTAPVFDSTPLLQVSSCYRFLRPKYVRNIETHLQAIAPDLYDGLFEQVKTRVLAYISELADNQDKLVVMMLIKAGMVKRLVAEGPMRIQ